MNSLQKQRVSVSGEFINLCKFTSLSVATQVIFENPFEINFGSAHQRIVDTGNLQIAQLEAHTKRVAFARQIINSPQSMAQNAAIILSGTLVEELTRRGLDATPIKNLLIGIANGSFPTGDSLIALESVILGVIEHSFSALSGFNANSWGLSATP